MNTPEPSQGGLVGEYLHLFVNMSYHLMRRFRIILSNEVGDFVKIGECCAQPLNAHSLPIF